jgi:hypothetical protein
MFVLWRLLNGFTRLTGLQLEEIFHGSKKEPTPAAPASDDSATPR